MQMKYLVYGWRGLGAEAVKHLVLNGVAEVHVYDPNPAEIRDLGSNYFFDQKLIDGSTSRAEASLEKLAILNHETVLKVVPEFKIKDIIAENYNGVIITEAYGIDWCKNPYEKGKIFF